MRRKDREVTDKYTLYFHGVQGTFVEVDRENETGFYHGVHPEERGVQCDKIPFLS